MARTMTWAIARGHGAGDGAGDGLGDGGGWGMARSMAWATVWAMAQALEKRWRRGDEDGQWRDDASDGASVGVSGRGGGRGRGGGSGSAASVAAADADLVLALQWSDINKQYACAREIAIEVWSARRNLKFGITERRSAPWKALLAGGADPNGPFAAHQDGTTPLHAAAYRGNHACVEVLLRGGAHVNVPCRRGFTALHAAAVPGHVACARTLLLAGADCSRRDALGHVPMCYAVQNANVPLARVILQHQAAALAKNGKTLRDVYGADAPKCRHNLSTAFAQWLPAAYRK
ncbi:Transient receptor potential channel pyrexia [Gryllus bimaculatus]|nr:Transient receptor potential channel pyrexia [Gryllus bimaculatus]